MQYCVCFSALHSHTSFPQRFLSPSLSRSFSVSRSLALCCSHAIQPTHPPARVKLVIHSHTPAAATPHPNQWLLLIPVRTLQPLQPLALSCTRAIIIIVVVVSSPRVVVSYHIHYNNHHLHHIGSLERASSARHCAGFDLDCRHSSSRLHGVAAVGVATLPHAVVPSTTTISSHRVHLVVIVIVVVIVWTLCTSTSYNNHHTASDATVEH